MTAPESQDRWPLCQTDIEEEFADQRGRCPHELHGYHLVEDITIAIFSVLHQHGLGRKRCLECRRGYIIGRNLVIPERMLHNKKQ